MNKPQNKYTQSEDKMLYDLREIKINMGSEHMTAMEITKRGNEIRKKYGLKLADNLRPLSQNTSPN